MEENKSDDNDDNQDKDIALKDHGIYLLTEQISTSTVKPVLDWILRENLRPKRKKFLQLIINSPGGSCAACFALTDIMEGSAIPVRTTGLGMIASCGLLIFMTGEKGHRIITPNTCILSHQYSGGSVGKHHELVADRIHHDLLFEMILRHYKKHTGLSKKAIIEKLLPESDVWLTPKDALEMKICDEIKLL